MKRKLAVFVTFLMVLSMVFPVAAYAHNDENVSPNVAAIIERIDRLPAASTLDRENASLYLDTFLELYQEVEQLSEEERSQISNIGKLEGLRNLFIKPVEKPGSLQTEVDLVIYDGPVGYSSLSHVISQNEYLLSYVRQQWGNGEAVSEKIASTVDYRIADKAREVIGNRTSASDKARAIYAWVAENIYYDYDYYYHGAERPADDALNVFLNGIAVCEGYANLLRAMLNSVGVPCLYVSGTGIGYNDSWNSDNYMVSDHAWNIININGQWLFADATWDSPGYYEYGTKHNTDGYCYFDYYCLDVNTFSYDHNTLGVERIGVGDGMYVDILVYGEDGKYYSFHNNTLIKNMFLTVVVDTYYWSSAPNMNAEKPGFMMYFGSDGAAVSGWYTYGNKKFYFDPASQCRAATGVHTIGNTAYYFNPVDARLECTIVDGWNVLGGVWYYYLNGQPVDGWLNDGGTWRYLNEGQALYGFHFIDGYYRYFADGSVVLAPGLYCLEGAWRCILEGGIVCPPGFHFVDGYYRYVGDGGTLMPPGWYLIDGSWRYFAEGSIALYGWHYVDNAWRYFGDGSAPLEGWHNIDGQMSYFEGGVKIELAA